MADVPWESEEGRNYICVRTMLTDVVSEELRKYFKQEWNNRYQVMFGAWDDTPVSGLQLFHAEKKRARPSKNMLQSKFQDGDTSQWDCTVLFDAIRFSNSIGSTLTPAIKTALDELRDIRNKKLGHIVTATFSDTEYQTIVNDIEDAFKTLGIPVHDLTKIGNKRNLYKSFQVLPPKPTHEVVYRKEKIDEIKQDLEKLRTDNDDKLTYFYISGNPGSGKSQLARQLGENLCKGEHWSTDTAYIMTLDAKDVHTLLNSYERFCRRLNCNENVLQNLLNSPKPKEEKIEDLRSQITTRIKNWKRWWIIVDNVEDLDIISPLLPQMGDENWNNGQIILTTQNIKSVPSDSLLTKHISLSGGMNSNECHQLLSALSGTDIDDPLLDEVAKQLDYQPLAMAAASVYVKELTGNKFFWKDYLEKFENGKRHITEELLCHKSSAYLSTMSAAVFLAVKKSAEKSSVLEQTFNLFSLISFQQLPIDIIVNYIQQLDQNCDQEVIYLAIKHCSLFLIEENEDHINVRIHRVVYESVKLLRDHKRNELEKKSEPGIASKRARIDLPRSVQNVVKALYCFETRDDQKKIIPHLKAFNKNISDLFPTQQPWHSLTSCFGKQEIFEIYYFFATCLRKYCEFSLALELQNINRHLYEDSKDDITLANIYSQLCMLYLHLGKLDQAKEHGHRALEINLKALDPTNVVLATSYHDLAAVYQHMGELKQAKEYDQRALEIRTKSLGPTHIDVATSYNNLGSVYKDMGELEQAKNCHERALEIKIKALGPTHVDVCASYNNVGLVYQDMGELEQAKDYLERALEIRLKALGPTHINVATLYNNLGIVIHDMGALSQAKDYCQRALEIQTKALGPNHVNIATSCNNLAAVYQDMGELGQAKDYHQRALEIRISALGPSHLKVGQSLSNLGAVYQDMRELVEAKDYYERALEILTNALAPTHVDVGESYNNLGAVYKDMGELQQAKEYYQRALEIRIKALGLTHINVAGSYNNLGTVYQDMGELKQAKNYHQRALEIRTMALGPAHVDVGASHNNLGAVYTVMGELEQAKDCHQRALEIRIKALGPTHVHVGHSYNNLGIVYKHMGDLQPAKDYYQRGLAIRIKALGPTHIHVGHSYNNLGRIYKDLGELEQAKYYHQRALEIRINALGPTHVHVGHSYNNLGEIYTDIGELELARYYHQRALEIRSKALGPTHIHVSDSCNNHCLAYKDRGELEMAKDYYHRYRAQEIGKGE